MSAVHDEVRVALRERAGLDQQRVDGVMDAIGGILTRHTQPSTVLAAAARQWRIRATKARDVVRQRQFVTAARVAEETAADSAYATAIAAATTRGARRAWVIKNGGRP